MERTLLQPSIVEGALQLPQVEKLCTSLTSLYGVLLPKLLAMRQSGIAETAIADQELATHYQHLLRVASTAHSAGKPAITQLLDDARKTVAQLEQSEVIGWDAFVVPLEAVTERLGRAWGVVGHLNAVVDTPELRAAYNENLPKVTEFWTELGQNLKLFEKYKAIEIEQCAERSKEQAKFIEFILLKRLNYLNNLLGLNKKLTFELNDSQTTNQCTILSIFDSYEQFECVETSCGRLTESDNSGLKLVINSFRFNNDYFKVENTLIQDLISQNGEYCCSVYQFHANIPMSQVDTDFNDDYHNLSNVNNPKRTKLKAKRRTAGDESSSR
jgi:hypothetical protein